MDLKLGEGKKMTDIYSISEVEPEFVKMIIPISFYVPDECWIDPRYEFRDLAFPAEYGEEPEFVKMVIPILAYEQDEFLSYGNFGLNNLMQVIGNPYQTPDKGPGQPGAMV
jgi:hypothetical protein